MKDTPDVSNLQNVLILSMHLYSGLMLQMPFLFCVLMIYMWTLSRSRTLRHSTRSTVLVLLAGRLSGKRGKTKFAIENANRTRIVIADTKIRILGSFLNIKFARDSLCSLILGSPAGKVYSRLRAFTAKLAENY